MGEDQTSPAEQSPAEDDAAQSAQDAQQPASPGTDDGTVAKPDTVWHE